MSQSLVLWTSPSSQEQVKLHLKSRLISVSHCFYKEAPRFSLLQFSQDFLFPSCTSIWSVLTLSFFIVPTFLFSSYIALSTTMHYQPLHFDAAAAQSHTFYFVTLKMFLCSWSRDNSTNLDHWPSEACKIMRLNCLVFSWANGRIFFLPSKLCFSHFQAAPHHQKSRTFPLKEESCHMNADWSFDKTTLCYKMHSKIVRPHHNRCGVLNHTTSLTLLFSR